MIKLTSLITKTTWLLLAGLLLLSLNSCSQVSLKDAQTAPFKLTIEEYFAGKTTAHGIVFDRNGAAQRYFTADIIGKWDVEKKTLTLDESFNFTDGEVSKRFWTIIKHSPQRYTGTAPDVIGEAQGIQQANILRWNYTLNINYQGQDLHIDFDDWMFLQADGVMINRAIMRKFGIQVGEVLISFQKDN